MTLSQAQKLCLQISEKYATHLESVNWESVFKTEEELINALKGVYIPKKRTAPPYTFIGYQFIYSFAYYVQQDWTLSEKQMKQAKRLAVEIKKANAISEYKF